MHSSPGVQPAIALNPLARGLEYFMVPFFLEQLANINVARATVAVDPNVPVEEALEIKNNSLRLGSQVIVNFDAFNIKVDPRVLVISASEDDSTHGSQCYDVKLSLTKSSTREATNRPSSIWTANTPGNIHSLVCRACKSQVVRDLANSKDLPSEHWYELVECWICHETKPEEHRARMQPILARRNTLLVGSSYALVHAENVMGNKIDVDKEIAATIKWDAGPSAKWIPINCAQCHATIGEGQYKEGLENFLAAKLYKYAISTLPECDNLPSFMDIFRGDLMDAAKAHATYKFLIQGRKTERVYALIWLFNFDTRIIYNGGFADPSNHGQANNERVMKLLYIDCTEDPGRLDEWSKDKTADHLIYPDLYCHELLDTIKRSTQLLPPHMRIMDNPVMPVLHNFSVGFIKH